MKINPILAIDPYKLGHINMSPTKGFTNAI